jgi:hypothetical protein
MPLQMMKQAAPNVLTQARHELNIDGRVDAAEHKLAHAQS